MPFKRCSHGRSYSEESPWQSWDAFHDNCGEGWPTLRVKIKQKNLQICLILVNLICPPRKMWIWLKFLLSNWMDLHWCCSAIKFQNIVDASQWSHDVIEWWIKEIWGGCKNNWKLRTHWITGYKKHIICQICPCFAPLVQCQCYKSGDQVDTLHNHFGWIS